PILRRIPELCYRRGPAGVEQCLMGSEGSWERMLSMSPFAFLARLITRPRSASMRRPTALATQLQLSTLTMMALHDRLTRCIREAQALPAHPPPTTPLEPAIVPSC